MRSGASEQLGDTVRAAEVRAAAVAALQAYDEAENLAYQSGKRLDNARAKVLDARAAIIHGEVRAVLAAARVSEQLDARQARVLERAGVRSLLDVERLGRDRLLAIVGVGPATADDALSAAHRLRQRAATSVRIVPDPDERRPADVALLLAVAEHAELRQKTERPAQALDEVLAMHARPVEELRKVAHPFRCLFARRSTKGAWAAAAKQVAAGFAPIRIRTAMSSLQAASTSTPAVVDPWEWFSANTAAFVVELERLGISLRRERTLTETPPPGAKPPSPITDPPDRGAVPEPDGPPHRDRTRPRRALGGRRAGDPPRRRSDSNTGELEPTLQAAPAPSHTGRLPVELARQVERVELKPGPLLATLRRYQEFGAAYIVLQRRALLGDDMGLGKTVQAIAAMCHLYETGARHFLVVAPNSVLMNWEREIHRHSRLDTYLLHGAGRRAKATAWRRQGGVAITTYGTVGSLEQEVDLGALHMVVADEAHLLKNPDAKRSKTLRRIGSTARHVVLMTGTPLENRLSELYHVAVLANPRMRQELAFLLDSRPGPQHVQSAIAPVYLRRTQEDVLLELPERIEIKEEIELGTEDRRAYERSGTHIMHVRQAATLGARSNKSGKLGRLHELLEEYATENKKVVIFSYFLDVLSAVQAETRDCQLITGTMTAAQRQRVIDEFSARRGHAVLASQIEAGGLGVNLQAAQVVILMEPQYKPSTEQQAIARVHRMGQSRRVIVHRLIAIDTIDKALVRLLEYKAEVFSDYANDSMLTAVSDKARDPSVAEIERELQKMLDEEGRSGRGNSRPIAKSNLASSEQENAPTIARSPARVAAAAPKVAPRPEPQPPRRMPTSYVTAPKDAALDQVHDVIHPSSVTLASNTDQWHPVIEEEYHREAIQNVLSRIPADPRRELLFAIAVLDPEPTNPNDPTAIKVVIEGEHVGYVPPRSAGAYQSAISKLASAGSAATCPAWLRPLTSNGKSVRVHLAVAWPPTPA